MTLELKLPARLQPHKVTGLVNGTGNVAVVDAVVRGSCHSHCNLVNTDYEAMRYGTKTHSYYRHCVKECMVVCSLIAGKIRREVTSFETFLICL